MAAPRIVVAPVHARFPHDMVVAAVQAGGGEIVAPEDADGLVWVDPANPKGLNRFLRAHPQLRWVQLPYAGVEPYIGVIDTERVWTAGKGVYAVPVAEHALGLLLAGLRGIGHYARQTHWSRPVGVNLVGARVAVLGGGGITGALLPLLAPFRADVTVVRRHPQPMDGARRVVGPDGLDAAIDGADAVVVALALTPDTEGVLDERRLRRLAPHGWVVNVAHGKHVVTDDLVTVLREPAIGGAAIDVTDPEPLPPDHPLWTLDNCIITPHIGNTPEMAIPLLSERISENVRRFGAGQSLVGVVDADAGY